MKVWLDDVRPCPNGCKLAKTADEAINLIKTGEVVYISFDHDLGEEKTGYDVAVWIERTAAIDSSFRVPDYSVHSANPVGAKKIDCAMKSALKVCKNPHDALPWEEVPNRY